MSSAASHLDEARREAKASFDLLNKPEVSRDDLAGALRHARNTAGQIVQVVMARKLDERNK